MVAVLFICMGNICRSPMAEGAFRNVINESTFSQEVTIDSAGTIGYHAGSPPDPRAIETSKRNGVNIAKQRSRKVQDSDFAAFDYILAMDRDNYNDLIGRCPPEYQGRISMFLDHAPNLTIREMPDPYYGHGNEFDTCFSAAIDAAEGLLQLIKKDHF